MEPLEWKPATTACLIFVMLSTFFALVWALLCCVLRAWGGALMSLAVPLPALLWQQWQRRRSVVFYPDHLEDRTWFSAKTVLYDGLEAELRTRLTRFSRGLPGNGHLPLLTLYRDGTAVAAVPRSLCPGPDALRQMTEILQAAGVPVRRLV